MTDVSVFTDDEAKKLCQQFNLPIKYLDGFGKILDRPFVNIQLSNYFNQIKQIASMVSSVNGKTGVVVLTAADVGAPAGSGTSTGNNTGDQDLSGLQVKRIVVDADITAVNDGAYTLTANATFTDPSPVDGKGYTVFIRNGGATVGGVLYSVVGQLIFRFYSGAWATYQLVTQTQLNAKQDSLGVVGFTDYSATSTIVGWSSFTNKVVQYLEVGNIAFYEVFISGTSNSATTTFTIAHTALNSTTEINAGLFSGIIGILRLALSAGSSTCFVDRYNTVTSTTTMSASGTKSIYFKFFLPI